MTRRFRRILLCLAIIFFAVATPSMLLYALGYSFDWQNKKPVLVGGLYLKSTPKKAKIYINDKFKKETPAFLKRLIPKEYQIKIAKDGFHSWQKKMKIESKLVTEARNILLVPKNLEMEIVNEKIPENFNLKEFINLSKSNNIFYIQKPSYILYRTDPTGTFQEQISLTPLPVNQEYQIFTSSNQRITVLSGNQELYLFNQETKAFELISRHVKGLEFSADNKKLLYFTPLEIWVFYLEDAINQPNKRAGQKELITRLSQEIKDALWYSKTNQHIIFNINNTVKIIELDGRDERNAFDLFKMEIRQIVYHPEEELLYFVRGEKLLRTDLE